MTYTGKESEKKVTVNWYKWFTLLYPWNEHNICKSTVLQSFFLKKGYKFYWCEKKKHIVWKLKNYVWLLFLLKKIRHLKEFSTFLHMRIGESLGSLKPFLWSTPHSLGPVSYLLILSPLGCTTGDGCSGLLARSLQHLLFSVRAVASFIRSILLNLLSYRDFLVVVQVPNCLLDQSLRP